MQLLRRPISASDRTPDRFYVISMKVLSLSRRSSSSRNVPSGEERGETSVFAGYTIADIVVQFYPWFNLILFCFKFIHGYVSPRQKQPPLIVRIVRCSGRQFYSEIRSPFDLFS